MKKSLVVMFLMLSFCHLALCAEESVLSKKIEADIIMLKVVMYSRSIDSLETLGKNTMIQSKEFLKLGKYGLDIISEYKSHPDWKVRFWVSDMLGYIKDKKSRDILVTMISTPGEKQEIIKRAKLSLNRIQ